MFARMDVLFFRYAQMHTGLPFALGPDGRPVSVAEVPRGLSCGCRCPSCGERLVARKGSQRDHHFAHEGGSDCATGYETAVHLAVKSLLEKTKRLLLPPCYAWHIRLNENVQVTYETEDVRKQYPSSIHFDYHYGTTGVGALPKRLVEFDNVVLEASQGNIRPDLICYRKGVPLYVEVAVAHFVAEEKLRRIRARGISTLELDFSDARDWDWAALEQRLTESVERKRWLLNRVADELAYGDRLDREARTLASREMHVAPVTHESEFIAGPRPKSFSTIKVFLCPSYVGVRVKGDLSGHAGRQRFWRIMSAECGTYDMKHNVWQFRPASEELFLKIERSLRTTFPPPTNGHLTLRLPEAHEMRLRKLLGLSERVTE